MKTSFSLVIAAALVASAAIAQKSPDNSPEKAAVVANDKAYEAAYAKGDVKALADFFTDDAEYTADDGRTFSGRAGIEAAIRDSLAANRGSKLAIEVDSVRVLAPEVVLERGSTTVKVPPGASPAGGILRRFKAVTTIEELDRPTQTVTFKGPLGNCLMTRVADPSRLTQVRIGDTVVIVYTEALAVSLEKIEKKSAEEKKPAKKQKRVK
jgi:uncharacterized protein (TIGR02246 family)